jgi:hypothetical protein
MAYPYYTEPTHQTGQVINTAATGYQRTTTTANTEQRLIVDAVDKIFLLEPNKHPLVTLLTNVGKVWDGKAWKGSGMMKRATGNPEFKWFEDVYGGRYARAQGADVTAAANQNVTVTGAGSSSAAIFTLGDVVKNARTGECFTVGAVTVATNIIVAAARGFGSTAAAVIKDGDGLFIIGNVNEENSGARNVNSTQTAPQTNYTQIFKTTIALSNTEKEANLYGGKDLPYQRAKKGTEHALDIERAFWWGQKFADTGVYGHPRRSTGGVHEFISAGNSYVQNQGGPLTAPDMNTFLREGFTYGNDTKLIFAGGIVLQAINEIARGQILCKPVETTYGMKISTWVTAFGTVNIVHNPLFVQDYAGYAFMMDMDAFAYRFMNNRDTSLQTNIQAPDADGEVDQYITECGLQREQSPKHALLLGVTS